MATKKKIAAAPQDIPNVVTSEDGNKTVARAKAALMKKWSLGRMESLLDTARLGWFFVALRRDSEARELAQHVCERIVFSGNHNIWSPASQSIVLAARLARLRGDEAGRVSHVARLVEHPAVAPMPREALAKWIAEADKDIRSAEVEPAAKWALEGFARGCARASYFRETAAEGAYERGTVDVTALDRTIEEGLAGLRGYLAR